jgi:hypothetical protein
VIYAAGTAQLNPAGSLSWMSKQTYVVGKQKQAKHHGMGFFVIIST